MTQNINTYDPISMHLVGNVEDNDCIIVDDIIDNAEILISAAEELHAKGAKNIYAFATHGVLSRSAIDILNKSIIKKIVITNTIPFDKTATSTSDKFIILSSANLIAETIRRIFLNESLSQVFL